MRIALIVFLILLVVVAGFVFFDMKSKKTTITPEPMRAEFDVSGLIPFEQWKANKDLPAIIVEDELESTSSEDDN
jgi:hypothetical protein